MEKNKSRVLQAAFLRVKPYFLCVLALTTAVRALAVIVFASSIAQLIVATIAAERSRAAANLALACGAAVLRGLVAWVGEVVSTRIAICEKDRYREQLLRAAMEYDFYDDEQHVRKSDCINDKQPASMAYMSTFGVEELSKFYTQLLPAGLNAVMMPLMAGVTLLFHDMVSALIVAFTIPLVPLFMILIGLHTQERVSKTQEALAALADHLSELIQGIPVIIGLGRAKEQALALDNLSYRYRMFSMQTLKVAFLSSLALELISTLSVAVVAVFSGVRLVQGQMDLELGLFVLLLVPECYASLQDVGAAFHASEIAKTVLFRIQKLSGVKGGRERNNAAGGKDRRQGKAQEQILWFKGFNISYHQNFLFPQGIDAAVTAGQTVLLRGASGSGKSSLIAALTKTLPSYAQTEGHAVNCADHVIWVSQEAGASQQTVVDELKFYGIDNVDALVEEIGLQSVRMMPVSQLSPGELRRLDMVRAIGSLGALAGDRPLNKVLIILDEPTAHLDGSNAQKIRNLIRRQQACYPECTWIISTHDTKLAQLCNKELCLAASVTSGKTFRAGFAGKVPALAAAKNSSVEFSAEISKKQGVPAVKNQRSACCRALQIFSILLAVAATASGVCLSALSGWLIIQAGQQLPIFYLMTAIVGVRFFGIMRSVLAYWARLMQHNAIFAVIMRLRGSLWEALSRKGLASRAVLTPGEALGQMIGDLQTLEQNLPRAATPLLVVLTLHVVMIVVVSIVVPSFILWQVSFLTALILVAVAAWGRMRKLTEISGKLTKLLEQTMTYMSRLKIITVNGQGEKLKHQLQARHHEIAEVQKKYSYGEGLSAAFLTAAFLAIAAAAPYVLWDWASGRPDKVALIGALMLSNIALVRPSIGVIEAIRHSVVVKNVRKRLKSAMEAKNPGAGELGTGSVVDQRVGLSGEKETFKGLSLSHADIMWDLNSLVCRGLNFSIKAGDRIIVSGPSGSGKSTLIAVLMGYLPITQGTYKIDFSDGTVKMHCQDPLGQQWHKARALFAWCPQQAHIFSSTIRGNLQLASTVPFSDEQLHQVLDQVRLQELYCRGEGLDYFVGSSGSRLSGGQRTRLALARALLTDAEVIILDEPTAHLDDPTAREVLSDLRHRLGGKTLIMVSHNPKDMAAEDLLFEMA